MTCAGTCAGVVVWVGCAFWGGGLRMMRSCVHVSWLRGFGNVGGIRESGGLDLWRIGVLVGVKQGERVGDCKGVERGVGGGVVRSVGLLARGKKSGKN